MKVHEYQAKKILRDYGVRVPAGCACFSVAEAVQATETIGGDRWVIKAQIHAGGRGKGGGVRLARSIEEVASHAGDILGMQLVTHQTGPRGQKVERLLVEQGIDIKAEFYVGLVVDRASQKVAMMVSAEGGTEIEEVAQVTPERVCQFTVEPGKELGAADALQLAQYIGLEQGSARNASTILQQLYRAFWEMDASLAEINPLVLTNDGEVIALDAKINFDDNALFRHPEVLQMRDLAEEDTNEIAAANAGLSYIALEGNIGCLVNGAGLAMATMDIIKLYGGEPANFLDVGGGATTEQVTEAFKIMLKNPNLEAILVNIFGGIMRCDVVAEGLVQAAKVVKLGVPLVVRLEGTNVELGRQILQDSNLDMITASTMADAAELAVTAAGA
ncbi:MAG: ADP-forming succinate--CoA ligase subunit beta [Arenicellales bacterium]|jgi:succinyl-CoA synthetase beta subunit|nr:ADP-forming succinate--CoA ligase subunit beta [Acidiferrobacteraceae bacterium]MDP6141056.1 ADP-forming succinate--CoA ligase subunit beta [Arenicellales bacterium]MDP6313761.1 ADP-forming succinate--CoA ligase subunit beta [Arenicellales bacterium]MDP7193162.1 ADP-forming succinate--CoA ligase subunit beta [Arenicellales bacterium]MDP7490298.1 ADP-forming succinate--CoA ligase subunit beta [Arenicellales bacterium]|tara:strand:+ start:1005 stop:2168 length:1164 start_codon:yes stop_codon:yes gene_type:complete